MNRIKMEERIRDAIILGLERLIRLRGSYTLNAVLIEDVNDALRWMHQNTVNEQEVKTMYGRYDKTRQVDIWYQIEYYDTRYEVNRWSPYCRYGGPTTKFRTYKEAIKEMSVLMQDNMYLERKYNWRITRHHNEWEEIYRIEAFPYYGDNI